jgi:hypothetical protein
MSRNSNRSLNRYERFHDDDGTRILVSQQKCHLKDNKKILINTMTRIKRGCIINHLQGSYAVLETLKAIIPFRGKLVTQSDLTFEECMMCQVQQNSRWPRFTPGGS